MRKSLSGLRRNLVESLQASNSKLTLAESCTGGLLTGLLTELSGSSAYIDSGFVVYSNEAKQSMLGVSKSTLKKHGAVSEEVAAEMLKGALSRSKAHFAIAITGIAGPTGGSEEKPVGTICFAWGSRKQNKTSTDLLQGNRQEIRHLAMLEGMQKLVDFIEA